MTLLNDEKTLHGAAAKCRTLTLSSLMVQFSPRLRIPQEHVVNTYLVTTYRPGDNVIIVLFIKNKNNKGTHSKRRDSLERSTTVGQQGPHVGPMQIAAPNSEVGEVKVEPVQSERNS